MVMKTCCGSVIPVEAYNNNADAHQARNNLKNKDGGFYTVHTVMLRE